ncbi:acyltransferase [Methanoculleus sp. FWC-SCC1]|uniref:Acyltransferase n=1 Tax=Methanoculleus frigidifontis TaxID=2584085 RepID=A0ABT8MCF5_9EURY|nr:acyltransferase [Methanoculleus sp. FWC-SCC1]MDN7025623.1 acyltransferase [Methanoculleus sp. FWC-SCC1]
MTARIGELEYLRGFAILAVIVVHVSVFFTEAARVDALAAVNLALYIVMHFAVPLFLFISGFVLALRYSGTYPLRRFYRRRFLTIGPPYLLFSAVYVLLPAFGALSLTGTLQLPSVDAAALAFLTGTAHYHLWFFVLIAQFYLLFPLIFLGYTAFERRGTVLFLLLALLFVQTLWNAGAHLAGAFAGTVWYALLIRIFVSHLFWFVLGIAASRHTDAFLHVRQRVPWQAMLLVVVLVTLLLTAMWSVGIAGSGHFSTVSPAYFCIYRIAEPVMYLPVFLLLFLAAERLAPSASRSSAALRSIGENSYGIYLIHPLVIAVLVGVFADLAIGTSSWLFYPLLFAVTLAATYVIVRVLERMPGSDLAGVRRREPAAAPSDTRPRSAGGASEEP